MGLLLGCVEMLGVSVGWEVGAVEIVGEFDGIELG